MLERLERLVRETGKAENVALRELQRAVTLQVKGEDLRCRIMFLHPRCKACDWRVVADPALHVGEDNDAVVSAVRALEDGVEVRAGGRALAFQPSATVSVQLRVFRGTYFASSLKSIT